jgi:DNA-binding HxlR family transcriptional regulator
LRELERDGVIIRTVYETVPPSVEYALTPLGKTLHAPLDAVTHWAEKHIAGITAARQRYDRAQ